MSKTNRGFELKHFNDTYGADCSIQESSSVEPHIWLGVHTPEIKVMSKDKDAIKDIYSIPDKGSSDTIGWQTVILPEEIDAFSRMHLNKKQAKWLIKQLRHFVKYGTLPEDDTEELE